jgi:hypothetical protein
MLMEVKVFGSVPPCATCKRVEEVARKTAAKFAGQVTVTKYPARSPEGLTAGFTATPAVVVNGRVVSQGCVPQEDELERIFRSELGG